MCEKQLPNDTASGANGSRARAVVHYAFDLCCREHREETGIDFGVE